MYIATTVSIKKRDPLKTKMEQKKYCPENLHRPWKKKVFKEITFRFWGPVPFQERTVTLRGCVFLFYFGFNFQTAPCSGASSSSFSVYSISPHHTFWEKKWLFGIPVKYSKIICVLRGNTWSAHEFDQQKQKNPMNDLWDKGTWIMSPLEFIYPIRIGGAGIYLPTCFTHH